MSEQPNNVNDNTVIAMPIRNIIAIGGAIAASVWAYTGMQEDIRNAQALIAGIEKEVVENTDFRIRWPRGDMGSLPADQEQFLLLENLAIQFDKLRRDVEEGNAPYDQQQQLTLEFYEKRIEQLEQANKELTKSILELTQTVRSNQYGEKK